MLEGGVHTQDDAGERPNLPLMVRRVLLWQEPLTGYRPGRTEFQGGVWVLRRVVLDLTV
jgi:hypothetical protein